MFPHIGIIAPSSSFRFSHPCLMHSSLSSSLIYVRSECCDFTGDSPCLNGGVCTDGIGSFTCDCAGTGFCGPTCVNPLDASQNGGQCPCEDDLTWTGVERPGSFGVHITVVTPGGPCSSFMGHGITDYRHGAANAAGVTAADACPIVCRSGCLLTFDDCCELSPHLHVRTACKLVHLSLTSLTHFSHCSHISLT